MAVSRLFTMDRRIRDQLLNRIESYAGDGISLGRLIADLDAVWMTEQWDDTNRLEFRRAWGSLEQIYATAMQREPPSLTPTDISTAKMALAVVREQLPPPTSG